MQYHKPLHITVALSLQTKQLTPLTRKVSLLQVNAACYMCALLLTATFLFAWQLLN